MRSIWHSLAWKEWHEHKWKLVSILAILFSMMVFVVIMSHRERHAVLESFYVSVLLGGIPLALFVGLGIAAGEQSRGTLRFLQALPVPMWRVAMHKLGFALLSLIAPVLLMALLVIAWRTLVHLLGGPDSEYMLTESIDGRPVWSGSWIIDVTLAATLATGSLVIWAAACGVNRKDEVSAGAVALSVLVAWWIVLTVLWLVLLKGSNGAETARLRAVGMASAPFGFLWIRTISHGDIISNVLGYASGVGTLVLLGTWFVIRFGRTSDNDIRSPRVAVGESRGLEYLAPPRRFAITAIAWKQARESSPIVLTGLIAIVGIFLCACLSVGFVEGEWFKDAGFIYSNIATVFGFFIALVAGIGVSLQDVGPRLNTFWRSRPIQPDLWFWTKFVTGLVVVFGAVYVPMGLFAMFGDLHLNQVVDSQDAITIPAMQIALFAAAVMMTCLVRQAVYAAILSIAVVYVGILVSVGVWWLVGFLGYIPLDRTTAWWEPTAMQLASGLIATTFICTVIAWLAMRNDWGRKSRY